MKKRSADQMQSLAAAICDKHARMASTVAMAKAFQEAAAEIRHLMLAVNDPPKHKPAADHET